MNYLLNKLDFVFIRVPWNLTVDFWIRNRTGDRWSIAQPPVFEEVEPLTMSPPPTMSLSEMDAQALCDALWEAGFKPSAGHGSVGQLAATEKHLADMRDIVFHQLGPGMEPPS